MDDKQLTPDQSLELIRDMVRQTRKNMTFKQGNLFLLWGYMLCLSALGIYTLLQSPTAGHGNGCGWRP